MHADAPNGDGGADLFRTTGGSDSYLGLTAIDGGAGGDLDGTGGLDYWGDELGE